MAGSDSYVTAVFSLQFLAETSRPGLPTRSPPSPEWVQKKWLPGERKLRLTRARTFPPDALLSASSGWTGGGGGGGCCWASLRPLSIQPPTSKYSLIKTIRTIWTTALPVYILNDLYPLYFQVKRIKSNSESPSAPRLPSSHPRRYWKYRISRWAESLFTTSWKSPGNLHFYSFAMNTCSSRNIWYALALL